VEEDEDEETEQEDARGTGNGEVARYLDDVLEWSGCKKKKNRTSQTAGTWLACCPPRGDRIRHSMRLPAEAPTSSFCLDAKYHGYFGRLSFSACFKLAYNPRAVPLALLAYDPRAVPLALPLRNGLAAENHRCVRVFSGSCRRTTICTWTKFACQHPGECSLGGHGL
jgi:hypothetical protein